MFFGRALIQLGILGLVSVVGTIGVSAGPPKPILTVSGMTGSGGPVPIDMAAIESLPQHTFRIIDPWEKIPRTYTGPLVTDVLELAGVPPIRLGHRRHRQGTFTTFRSADRTWNGTVTFSPIR